MNLSLVMGHLVRATRRLEILLDMRRSVLPMCPCHVGCCLGMYVLSWLWCVVGDLMSGLGDISPCWEEES